ncbi:unnamed protein product [Phytomonas sp. EM1]|nr:unnamed protein product [Phytomonas sp. EM1]|eukprot:CCW63038.1 unnamed protein product [Phytomonas sp. isolate EM1]
MAATASAHEMRLRDVFDLVATNDLTSLLTVICNINPFDCSPGLKCLLERIKEGNSDTNPYIAVLKELDVHTNTISTSRDALDNTPLHIAAGMGYALMLEALLLECTCEVNARNSLGFTSLHLASRQGHLECVKLLCAHGADVRLLTSLTEGDPFFRGRSAQFLAHWNGHEYVLRYLQKWIPRTNPGAIQTFEDVTENADACGKGHREWIAVAQQEDVARFAELFEIMDCVGCTNGPIPDYTSNTSGRVVVVPELNMDIVMNIILAVIPSDSDMTEAQHFIFEGFLSRGYVSMDWPEKSFENEHSLDSPDSILSRIISGGHVQALRTVCRYGLRKSCLCFLALDILNMSEESTPTNLINMRHILAEAVVRTKYEQALEFYRKKYSSSARKKKAWSAKCTLRIAQKELARVNIEPLTFSM